MQEATGLKSPVPSPLPRTGFSAMGLGIITAGAAAAVELRLVPELDRLREQLSPSSAGVAGRTAVNTVAVRVGHHPFGRTIYCHYSSWGVPGGVAIVYATAVQEISGKIDICSSDGVFLLL